MLVYSTQTPGAMLKLKNRRTKIPVGFGFSSKNRQNSSCEVGFDIPPLQALNLPPLAREIHPLPTWAEVHNITWVLHCFDAALLNQHINTS